MVYEEQVSMTIMKMTGLDMQKLSHLEKLLVETLIKKLLIF